MRRPAEVLCTGPGIRCRCVTYIIISTSPFCMIHPKRVKKRYYKTLKKLIAKRTVKISFEIVILFKTFNFKNMCFSKNLSVQKKSWLHFIT